MKRWSKSEVIPGSLLFALAEERLDIAVAFNHIHDFDCIANIAKENHVVLVRSCANVRMKIRTRATEGTWQASHIAAIAVELPYKSRRDPATPARELNVVADRCKIVPRTVKQQDATHLPTLSASIAEPLVNHCIDIIGGMAAATLD